jgi:Family of unknown function (DUF6297)
MTVTREAIAVPDTTDATIALLRELRRDRARQRAANAAYWIYLVVLVVALYGGSRIVAVAHDLRHPPPPTAQTPHVLHAAPYALAALALLLLLVLVRDALWRGPVILQQPAVDWLLDTPVEHGRLLRPRFRMSAAVATLAGAAVGVVPAAALVGLGLGGHSTGHVLRLTGAAILSAALLFILGTGSAGLIERYPASWRWLRRATPAVAALVAVLGGLAAWAALGRVPPAVAGVVMWSGPWGWAAQGMVALSGGSAPLWQLATVLLGAAALITLFSAERAAAGVPGAALRIRARTIGAMSAAVLSMDTRGVALAYGDAAGDAAPRRARFRLRPPRRRELILPWRDLLAVARAPARLAGAAALALAAVGLIALASHAGQVSVVAVGSGLAVGYLAAAWLCEGARLDAEDTRRSAALPFRFGSLAWWHAVVPCLVLYAVAGVPVVALAVASGKVWLLALLAVTAPVLVAGALVNVFRPRFMPDLFGGFETPVGNSAAIVVVFWLVLGPLIAVVPMALLLPSALGASHAGAGRAVVAGAVLAAGLGTYAARRAARLYTA